MTGQAQFIKRVISEITFGGRIPNKVNNDRLSDIMDNAIQDFKDEDDRCTMRHYIIIKNDNFHTEKFLNTRKVSMPDCVKAVTSLKLSNRQYLSYGAYNLDSDLSRYSPISISMGGNNTSILQAVATASYIDYLDTLSLDTVSYDFNEYSHELIVIGQKPSNDLVAEVYSYVNEEAMYKMPSFFKYVCGKCYEDYSIVTSFTRQKLLNEYELDISRIEKKGEKLISKVEKEWEAQKGESDFIVEW